MGWKVVEPKISRERTFKARATQERDWNQKYGEGKWLVGYIIDGEFVSEEDALESVYYRSYEVHFQANPGELQELIKLANNLRNPHAEATTAIDLQVPIIMSYLQRHSLVLMGYETVDIGSWQGQASHSISLRLSPSQIKYADKPEMTLEEFWLDRKSLAVWEKEQ